MKPQKKPKIDPLFVIFEQHLYNFHDADEDRKSFINRIIQDYLGYLRKKSLVVPAGMEKEVTGELYALVHGMLLKKIYGCVTIEDYQNKIPVPTRKRARSRYNKTVK